MCIVSHLSSFVTMLTAVHITLTILILPLARTTLDTNVSLDIFLMQLPRLVTKLEISKEEIPTQQGLKQLIIMSVFTDTKAGNKETLSRRTYFSNALSNLLYTL